jgi:hypothetical protein
MKSILIKDTTKEERRKIVTESLCNSDINCEDSGIDPDMYQSYIDGIKEISEINREFRAGMVVAHPETTGSSCLHSF